MNCVYVIAFFLFGEYKISKCLGSQTLKVILNVRTTKKIGISENNNKYKSKI